MFRSGVEFKFRLAMCNNGRAPFSVYEDLYSGPFKLQNSLKTGFSGPRLFQALNPFRSNKPCKP